MLRYSRDTHGADRARETIDRPNLVAGIVTGLNGPQHITVTKGGQSAIRSSRLAIRHILSNLVGNAIKYNDKPTDWVRIRAGERSDRTVLTVSHNGRGIPEDQRERVFSLFFVGNPEDVQEHGSTGVGLAIVRKLVDDPEGTISLDSTPGEGTRFALSQPQ